MSTHEDFEKLYREAMRRNDSRSMADIIKMQREYVIAQQQQLASSPMIWQKEYGGQEEGWEKQIRQMETKKFPAPNIEPLNQIIFTIISRFCNHYNIACNLGPNDTIVLANGRDAQNELDYAELFAMMITNRHRDVKQILETTCLLLGGKLEDIIDPWAGDTSTKYASSWADPRGVFGGPVV